VGDRKYLYAELEHCALIAWLILAVSIGCMLVGFFLTVFVFLIGLLGTFMVYPAVVGHGRYNKILVRDDLLVVGRETVPIGDLDPGFGAQTAEQALSPLQLAQIALLVPRRFQQRDVRLLGGGPPQAGTLLVVIKRRNGVMEAIAARDRDGLIRAIDDVLRVRPDPASPPRTP